MAESNSESTQGNGTASKWQPALPAALVRSSLFKYYIHDTADVLRLELLGELTEPDLQDLNGCWKTAKTTLAARKLVFDLRGLTQIDDAGKQWLAGMADEGATYLPDTYLRTGLAGQNSRSTQARNSTRFGFFGKLLSIFRGSSVAPAE